MANNKYPIVQNETENRFEIRIDDQLAVLEYRVVNGAVQLLHTEVPESFEGKGIASALAEHALEWARAEKRKVEVYCPFVKTYVKRHPEYNDIIV